MKTILGTAAVLALCAAPAVAQTAGGTDPIHPGALVVSGGTAITFQRMTFGGGSSNGSSSTSNPSGNFITSQAAMTFYQSEKFGIGPVLAFMHFSFPSNTGTGDTTGVSITGGSISLATIGGLAKLRFPLSPKTDFYVQGEGGYARFTSTNGYYFAGGAGADIYFAERIALNLGAQYQRTSLSGAVMSGLSTAAGFSVILK